MLIENVQIKDVLVDDSRFSMKEYIFEPGAGLSCQINSFASVGILYPVILYRDDRGQLHLVDGRKRINFARDMLEKNIRALILPPDTPVLDIITLCLCNRMNVIEASVMNKIQFICFAASLNTPESWILKTLCIAFEFRPHRDFLRECERIYALPEKLRRFCHEKKFSLKQLINISHHPPDILRQLVQWTSVLQFSASTLDEIASRLHDYLKREGITLRDFLSDPDVTDVLESSLSPRDRTEKLRELLRMKQYPVLSTANRRMDEIVNDLRLPKSIHISWDRTLEDKNVNVSLNIHDPAKWEEVLDTLKSDDVRNALRNILDEL